MNNSNALTEIQSKYQNCNLLIPSATSVQINPFYKCTVMEVVADTSEGSGDIFKVGNAKVGEDQNGKAIYTDVFSPAKPLLMKLATAAGIQFHPQSAPQAALPFANEAFYDSFNPEENLDNPAFASDTSMDEVDYAEDFRQAPLEQEVQQQTPPVQQTPPSQGESTGYFCDECGTPINEKVYEYSLNKFGRPLCMKCQKGAGK